MHMHALVCRSRFRIVKATHGQGQHPLQHVLAHHVEQVRFRKPPLELRRIGRQLQEARPRGVARPLSAKARARVSVRPELE